jgi:aspartyl-tRNA(Asn)/glutamyl-tRNA(Gln) amidotransferase subunit A
MIVDPDDRGSPVTASRGDVAFLGVRRLAALVRAREISPVEIVRLYLERIERLDSRLRAYITVLPDAALDGARRAEIAVMRGEPVGPLHGVPYAVKDQFDTAGVRTTSGSRIMEGHVPIEDATTIARLNTAGGILLGKLNLTEFALGGTQQFPFGQPRNPWNLDHDPGGSSSGSGIAVAAGLCAASLGEDTGGSVRSPASFCGVVGLRPTWSRVSRHGSFPLSWSMDTPGPLTRTVEDAAWLLQAIAGYDAKDPLSSRAPVPDYARTLAAGVRGLRVGVIRELTFGPETDGEVRGAVVAAARRLEELGAVTEEVSLRLVPLAGAIFMALADSDGAGVHDRWLRTRAADYDQGTRRRLLTASLIPAAIQQRAARARALLGAEMRDALARHDLLLCPTAHQAAPPIAAARGAITSRSEVAGRFFTRRSYVTPAALAGLPAIAVPCGFTRSGMPLSLQLIARHFDEVTLLRAAHAYERHSEWWRRRPPDAS